MELRVINGARVLASVDGTNQLFIDIGSAVIPIAVSNGDGNNSAVGADGGYYTPKVNETTGYVTWTASKPDMPPIAPSNIRGPRGYDGRSVFGINISVDTAGAITGGTVFYDDGSTSNITFSLSEG